MTLTIKRTELHKSLMSKAISLMKEIGGETYIVGGAVRDLVLGLNPQDIDLATNVDIEDICARFKTHDIGKNKDFGIVVVEYKGSEFEVAHFRADGVYTDGRRPDSIQYVKTIEEDLARRDFTINAMAFDGEKVIDPFGGMEDLEKGIVRFVGKAEDRIAEDKLRILRAYRFSAKLKFAIKDEEVMRGYDIYSNVAMERIMEEIRKVAEYGGKELAWFIDKMRNNEIIINEIMQEDRPHQHKHHPEGGVYSHILHCLNYCDTEHGNYLTRLCVLWHDIGKDYTYQVRDGVPTYWGHDKVGAEKMEVIGSNLKLSAAEIETIKYVCENHMIWWELPNMKKARILEVALHKDYDKLKITTRCDELSRLYLGDYDRWRTVLTKINEVAEQYKNMETYRSMMKEKVDGAKIMKLRPELVGKWIWACKKATEEYIVDFWWDISQEDVDLFIKGYKYV